MNTLERIKDKFEEGLGQTWDSLREGWYQLQTRAESALTKFNLPRKQNTSSGELITADENILKHSSRWSVLACEVREYDDKVQVSLEVPGMNADDFDIRVIGTRLSISGEKRAAREEAKGNYYVMETAYGQFERSISLPTEVDDTKAKAKYNRGVLNITLPKLNPTNKKRIKIVSN
ncbi:MAG: Hsp20/alpha crystallin family protein [Gammaproteobacteria bacterium]|nr:Hsp20/alpha crystallin family protein [Gammaproteobacteria bacterium]